MLLELDFANEGSSNLELFCENEKRYLLKTLKEQRNTLISSLERNLVFPFIKDPIHTHLISTTDFKINFDTEIETWRLWKEEGIDCLNLKNYLGDKIIWVYEEGAISIRRLLEIEKSVSEFSNFLDVYHKLRQLAKDKQDIKYFHSDPHLSNFLVLKNKKVIPIDAGCVLNRKMSFKEIDLHLLKRTLYAISVLNSPEKNKKEYLHMFGERLTDEEKDFLINYNYDYGFLAKKYFSFRENVAFRLKHREKRNVFLEQDRFLKFAENNFFECLRG